MIVVYQIDGEMMVTKVVDVSANGLALHFTSAGNAADFACMTQGDWQIADIIAKLFAYGKVDLMGVPGLNFYYMEDEEEC